METTLLIIILILVAVAIVLLFVFRNKGNNDIPQLLTKVNELQNGLTKIETNLKVDFRINREENTANAKTNREELNKAIADFRTEIMTAVKTMTEQNNTALEKLNQTLEQKVTALIDKNDKSFKAFTDGNTVQLEKIEKKVEENLKALNEQAKADNTLMREALVNAFKGLSPLRKVRAPHKSQNVNNMCSTWNILRAHLTTFTPSKQTRILYVQNNAKRKAA